MAQVTCPTCWVWMEQGKRTTCKKCGSTLIHATGLPVTMADASGQPLAPMSGPAPDMTPPSAMAPGEYQPPGVPLDSAAPPGYPPAFGQAAYPAAAPGPLMTAGPAFPMNRQAGRFPWLGILRCVFALYAVVTVVLLVGLAVAARPVATTMTGPTGAQVTEMVDPAAAFWIFAVLTLGVAALVMWLLKFVVIRIILLLLQALGILSLLVEILTPSPVLSPTVPLWALAVGLVIEIGFAAIVAMSIMHPPLKSYTVPS